MVRNEFRLIAASLHRPLPQAGVGFLLHFEETNDALDVPDPCSLFSAQSQNRN
jgi:hypothetical protein